MLNFYEGHKVYMNGQYPAIFLNGENVHVHRLEWQKHFDEIPKGYIVHHKDEDKTNWNIDNLELISRADHVRKHQYNLHNESTRRFGEEARNHKLTQEEVNFIRLNYKRYDKKCGATALGKKFCVTPSCICAIAHNTNWR